MMLCNGSCRVVDDDNEPRAPCCSRPRLLCFGLLASGLILHHHFTTLDRPPVPGYDDETIAATELLVDSSTRSSSSPTFVNLLGPMVEDWWRQGSITNNMTTTLLPTLPAADATCNCQTNSNNASCCWRFVARSHKMGYEWSLWLGRRLDNFLTRRDAAPIRIQNTALSLTSSWPQTDMRAILLLRNIYAALTSGYLYHKAGRECWLDPFGEPVTSHNDHYHKPWRKYIQTIPRRQLREHDSLCHLLANETTAVGMSAYIEWVMTRNYQWHGIFAHLALVRHVPWIQARTRVACFEQVTTAPVQETMQQWIDFYYPQDAAAAVNHHPRLVIPDDFAGLRTATATTKSQSTASTSNYTGGHSTSHDPRIRKELHHVIQELDDEYFGGQIAWLDSVIPCG